MITVKQLITITSFPDDIKQELLAKADSFTPEKVLEVEEACWSLISLEYETKFQRRVRDTLEVPEDQVAPTREQIQQELLQELAAKLGDVSTEDAITDIREKLTEEQKSEEE